MNQITENRTADTPQRKKIGLICCSNGLPESFLPSVEELKKLLQEAGVQTVLGRHMFCAVKGTAGGTARERAEELTEMYLDPELDAVFDLSGGDFANEILPWIDYDAWKKAPKNKMLFGYSDLTSVLNAVYAMTGRKSGLYQLKNLLEPAGRDRLFSLCDFLFRGNSDQKKKNCRETVLVQEGITEKGRGERKDLTELSCRFLQNGFPEGTVVGGNLRCLLKLAGTPYFPDLREKILILEANSGGRDKITACFAQLYQMGAFEKVRGILLGTFSQLEHQEGPFAAEQLLRAFSGNLPVAVTREIGHGGNAGCAVIGARMRIEGRMEKIDN